MFVSFFALILPSQAQTVEETQQKISSTTDKIQAIESQIKESQAIIDTAQTTKKTLKSTLTTLDKTQKKLETDIKVTSSKVDSTDLKISQIAGDISYKESEINSREAALREAIHTMYENDQLSLTEIVFSKNNFSDLWGDVEALDQFSSSVRDNVLAVKALKADLEIKKSEQQTQKNTLLGLKSDLTDKKKVVEVNKKEKTVLLTKTSNQEATYTKLLKQQLATKDALEKELRDYETTLKFILDPKSIPSRGNKVFSMPLATVRITQLFGKTVDSVRLYASGTHNGVDFAADVGTPVKAMLGGTVAATGDTDLTCPGASFGRWVLIRHTNGLASLYGHFSLIKVSKGDVVTTGQLIGYSGNTGYTTGPHLHISVYANAGVEVQSLPSKACGGRTYTMPVAAINAYLDPMDYL